MTGQLGVLRINKDKLFPPDSHSGYLAATRALTGWCWWDTTGYEQTFGDSGFTGFWKYPNYGTTKTSAEVHLLDVFYLLVRVVDHKTEVERFGQRQLRGLLLLPNGKKKGRFRRIGVFEGWDNWETGLLSELSRETDNLDSRFFKRKRGNGVYTISII